MNYFIIFQMFSSISIWNLLNPTIEIMRLFIEVPNIHLRMTADWWYLREVFFAPYHLLYLLTVLNSHCLDIIIFFDVLSTHAGGNDNIQQKRSCMFNLGIFCLLATHQVYSLKSIALNFISISWIARVKIIHLIENHFAKIKTRLEYWPFIHQRQM